MGSGIARSGGGPGGEPVPLTEMYLRWGFFSFRAWRGEDLAVEIAELSEWARSIGESASDAAVLDLQAQVDYALGNFPAAADGWMAFAPNDPLNAPSAYLEAGTAAILGSDIPRTRAAIAGLAGAIGRDRYWVLNLRSLQVGLLALEGNSAEALREGRSVIAEYGRLGVPWRQAVFTLALVHALGPGDPDSGSAPARLARSSIASARSRSSPGSTKRSAIPLARAPRRS